MFCSVKEFTKYSSTRKEWIDEEQHIPQSSSTQTTIPISTRSHTLLGSFQSLQSITGSDQEHSSPHLCPHHLPSTYIHLFNLQEPIFFTKIYLSITPPPLSLSSLYVSLLFRYGKSKQTLSQFQLG